MRRHVYRELSAYIDGEARSSERIAAHLDRCDACQREYTELLKLSASMKGLPYPDVRPEFTTRVMAHVRETAITPKRVTQPWVPVALALAVICTILGGAWFVQAPDRWNASRWEMDNADDSSWTAAATDEDAWADSSWPTVDGPANDEWPTGMMESLDHDAWTTPLVEAWGPGEDVDSMLLELDTEAEENFRALLWLYAQEFIAI